MLLKAVNGELDFHARHFNIAQNRPVLAEAREAGDFDFVAVRATSSNHVVVALNLNHQDDELREIFQNKDFRIGLSHAIDRQEVIDTVFQRQGEPWQAAPAPDSKFFDEEFAKQYTEYDLELANQHLDAVLPERDSAGFRLRPNGDRLRINIDVSNADPERVSAMELIIGQWEGVGVGAQVNTIERTLFYDRKSAAANEHDANVWGADGGFRVEMIETRWWFPSTDESNYAPRWANWYSTRGRGEFSEEPPEEARRQMELYQEILKEPDIEERERIFREILEISKEQFYAIGVVLRADDYGIVKNDLRNVPDSYINSAPHLSPGPTNPPIWFFDR